MTEASANVQVGVNGDNFCDEYLFTNLQNCVQNTGLPNFLNKYFSDKSTKL